MQGNGSIAEKLSLVKCWNEIESIYWVSAHVAKSVAGTKCQLIDREVHRMNISPYYRVFNIISTTTYTFPSNLQPKYSQALNHN